MIPTPLSRSASVGETDGPSAVSEHIAEIWIAKQSAPKGKKIPSFLADSLSSLAAYQFYAVTLIRGGCDTPGPVEL